MLKKVWDSVVRGYQNVRQYDDECRIRHIDEEIEQARKGYMTYVGLCPMGVGSVPSRVDISPEEAAAIIKERQEQRQALRQAMQERREKYDLK